MIFKNLLNVFSVVLVSFILINTVSAESNGIWHLAGDVRPGTFGSDETLTGFTFGTNLTILDSTISDSVHVNGIFSENGSNIVFNDKVDFSLGANFIGGVSSDSVTSATSTSNIVLTNLISPRTGTAITITDFVTFSGDIICSNCISEADLAQNQIDDSEIEDDSLTALSLAPGSVGSSEILDESITAADIHSGAVGSSEIIENSILAVDIAAGGVASSEILDESITAFDIGPGAVGSSELIDNSILAVDIATGGVASLEILDESITASDIGLGAVGSSEIIDNSITVSDIGPDAVDSSEIAPNAIGNSELDNSASFTMDTLTITNEIKSPGNLVIKLG